MDKQQAKLVLQAHHPTDLDASRPDFAQALALVDSDPELKMWWEAQQAFDQKVSAKLADVPIPDHLRDSILAGRKVVHFAPKPQFSFWLAAAAAVAILCAVGTSYRSSWEAARHISIGQFTETALNFLGNDSPTLAMTSSDHDKIVLWLKEQNAPTGEMPAKMASLPSVGCQKFDVNGHKVSLVCFNLAEGKLVHLFMVDQDALSDPPSRSAPDFKQSGPWSMASWSDGRMSYMLATQAGPDALKQLL